MSGFDPDWDRVEEIRFRKRPLFFAMLWIVLISAAPLFVDIGNSRYLQSEVLRFAFYVAWVFVLALLLASIRLLILTLTDRAALRKKSCTLVIEGLIAHRLDLSGPVEFSEIDNGREISAKGPDGKEARLYVAQYENEQAARDAILEAFRRHNERT